jgi:hypothetical protein
MQWLRQHRVSGGWLVIAVLSALTAILRLNAILTRGMDTMALVMLLVQVAMTAGAVFLAFWLPRQ